MADNGLRDQPWWVRAISIVGWPIATAVFFMLIWTGILPSPVTATAERLNAHMANDQEQIELLRLICIHTAKPDERDACVRPEKDLLRLQK